MLAQVLFNVIRVFKEWEMIQIVQKSKKFWYFENMTFILSEQGRNIGQIKTF